MTQQQITSNPNHELREANRALNITEFENGIIELESMPLAIFMELTQNCNLKCPYCRSAGKYRRELDMPIDLFRRIAAELFPTTTLVDLRGWGESTILKSFPEIISITADYGPKIRLVTNGMNPNEHIWDHLMALKSMIVISCDAADPELFSLLRTGGNLDQLKKTTKTIVRYRDHYGVPEDHVYFTAVVSRPNIEHLPELIEMAYDLGLPKVILFPVGRKPSHPWHLRHDIDQTRRGLIAAHERANKLGITLQLGSALDDALRLVSDVRTKCMHPWTYSLVDYAGRVGYCDLLLSREEQTFGSLYEKSFKEIWNGDDFKALRQAHVQRNLPDRFSACRWCFTMRYVDFEQYIHPSYQAGVVSNKTRIQLYEDGIPIQPVPEF
jgi:MoaA/NifB/PqqE/SkfB family radical SAM enzyme